MLPVYACPDVLIFGKEEFLRCNFIILNNKLVFLSLCCLISLDSVQSVEGKRKVSSRETVKQEPGVTVLDCLLEDSLSPCVDYIGMLYSCRSVTCTYAL